MSPGFNRTRTHTYSPHESIEKIINNMERRRRKQKITLMEHNSHDVAASQTPLPPLLLLFFSHFISSVFYFFVPIFASSHNNTLHGTYGTHTRTHAPCVFFFLSLVANGVASQRERAENGV